MPDFGDTTASLEKTAALIFSISSSIFESASSGIESRLLRAPGLSSDFFICSITVYLRTFVSGRIFTLVLQDELSGSGPTLGFAGADSVTSIADKV